MTTKTILLAASLLGLNALSASAEQLKLSRNNASELYVSLSAIEAGLTPSNSVIVADDINALRPAVEALDKGKTAFQKQIRALAKLNPPDVEAKAQALGEDLQTKADEELTFDLGLVSFTDDEVTAAKIKPAALAVIRRFLLKKTQPVKSDAPSK